MGVYLNYVTVFMEYVIFKTYAKQDRTVLSVTKVHVLYYINIVEKSGKCINKFKKEKKGKNTTRPGQVGNQKIDTPNTHIYDYSLL